MAILLFSSGYTEEEDEKKKSVTEEDSAAPWPSHAGARCTRVSLSHTHRRRPRFANLQLGH